MEAPNEAMLRASMRKKVGCVDVHGEMSVASGCVQKSRPAVSRDRRVELDSVSSGSAGEDWLLPHG